MMQLKFLCCIYCALIIICGVIADSDLSVKKSKSTNVNKSTKHHGGNGTVPCRYTKGPWSECNSATNTKTRTLSLKEGRSDSKCEKTKTVDKKCKINKVCRYLKGSWSECDANNQMVRIDSLKKSGNDPSCNKIKRVTKTCKNKSARNKGQQKKKHNKEQPQV